MTRFIRFAAPSLALSLLVLAACADTTYSFEDVTVGEDDGARAPRERSNSQFVRAVYGDLVGRAPESYEFVVEAGDVELIRFPVSEQSLLVDVLEGMGDSRPLRALLTAGLVASAEVSLPERDEVDEPAELISEQFRRLLGRDPSAYELRAFVDEWEADEAVGPLSIVRALIGSREYQSF
jgi:hypothetical protein